MKFLALPVIETFKGLIADKNNLYFKGYDKSEFLILYKQDNSSIQSPLYYQIFNPTGTPLIQNIYCFTHLTDAIKFYHTKQTEYFSNSLIMVFNKETMSYVIDYLDRRFTESVSNFPTLHLFHRPNIIDLYIFYLEMLKKDIYYNILYISNEIYLNLQYKSVNLQLTVSQLHNLKFHLGIGKTNYSVRNKKLDVKKINSPLNW